MSLYQSCLNRIRDSVTNLTLPPLGLLPVMLDERKKARDKEQAGFALEQAAYEQTGQEAMTRILLRHKPMLTTHHTDYRQAIAQLTQEESQRD